MKVEQEKIQRDIERARKCATIQDMRMALLVHENCSDNDLSPEEAIAVGIRYGIRAGRNMAPHNADNAWAALRDYQGRNDKKYTPQNRIIKASEWIMDPEELHRLSAFLEGRAAAIEAGEKVVDAQQIAYERTMGKNSDVNSDGIEEDI